MWTCAIKGLRAAFPVKYCLELGAGITVKDEQTTYLDFTEVSQAVEAAELVGVFYRTELPCWYEEGPPVLGGGQFFCCFECGAYWRLQLAEHSQRGSWERIA